MVFAGEFWAGASGRGLSEGFRDLGWAVQEIDLRDFLARPGKDLLLRLASRLTRTTYQIYREKLLDECRTLKPDVFLTIKGVGITSDLLRRIEETGTRTVMYYPDLHFDYPGVSVKSFCEYDLFITTKTFHVNYLEELLGANRVAYVPHGYSGNVHRPPYADMTEADFHAHVLYAGNHSTYKQQWIEEAVSSLPDATLQLVGNRWRESVADGPLARCAVLGERIGLGYAEAIQTSCINIAIHFGPAAGWEDRVSTRTFEIPACRGFMLHIDNDEVREFFEPGVEIDVFATPEELADKIRFYLAKPELRSQMIQRAYQRCVPAYSYGARAQEVADLLELQWGISAA